MQILDSKYRGSKPYFEAYKQLVAAARRGETITYKPLIVAMGLKPGNYAQREVGIMLGEISEDTHRASLPLLTAIVINATTQEPGTGFFELAVTLGKISAGLTEAGREAFWLSEVERVFAATWPSSATSFTIKR